MLVLLSILGGVLLKDALGILKFLVQLLHLLFDLMDALLSFFLGGDLAVALGYNVDDLLPTDCLACQCHCDEAIGLHILAVKCLGGFDSVFVSAAVAKVEDCVFCSEVGVSFYIDHVGDFVDSGDDDVFHDDSPLFLILDGMGLIRSIPQKRLLFNEDIFDYIIVGVIHSEGDCIDVFGIDFDCGFVVAADISLVLLTDDGVVIDFHEFVVGAFFGNDFPAEGDVLAAVFDVIHKMFLLS